MNFLQEYKNNFYINKNNLFYGEDNIDHESLFEHPKDMLKKSKKNTKSLIIYSSSSSEDEYVYEDYEGGKKENKKTKKSKNKYKKERLTVLPTFINTIRGKIIYTNQTKLELEKIEPKNKEVILGTIIDLKYVKTEIKNKNNLMDYIKTYNVIPLMFDYDNENIINKNRKKNFFSSSSSLLFLTFKLKNDYTFYKEVIENSPYESFKDISEVLKEKKYIIAHYIYENYYMLLNTKKHNFELYECYAIDKDHKIHKQNLSNINSYELSEKMFLDDFIEVLKTCKKHLTQFN